MKGNWFYILVGFLFVAMLFVSIRFFRGTGHASVGVTNSAQYRIMSEKSGFVKSLAVVPGQQVKQGELLVELVSAELMMEIERLNHRIATLRSDQQEKRKLAASKVALIQAESGIKVEELNTDIAESEGDLILNRQIVQSQSIFSDSTTQRPVAMKIESLRKQRSREEEAAAIRIKDILHENELEQTLLSNQINLLERELDLLNQEKTKLSKFATTDGVVESVFVKDGEQVQGFTPLLTINPVHPTTVVGYLVGRKEILPVGSKVTVKSQDRPRNETAGKVIGYGSVVPLPEILQKSTAVKAFGQEIFIEIDSDNQFAAGEKVLIR